VSSLFIHIQRNFETSIYFLNHTQILQPFPFLAFYVLVILFIIILFFFGKTEFVGLTQHKMDLFRTLQQCCSAWQCSLPTLFWDARGWS
jgi:hypothetical protein